MKRTIALVLTLLLLILGCSEDNPVRPDEASLDKEAEAVADVAITDFTASPGTIMPGEVLTLSATVANLGQIAARDFSVRIVEQVTGATLVHRTLPILYAGSSASGTVPFTVPAKSFSAAVEPGIYTLVCVHDYDDSYPGNDFQEIQVQVGVVDVPPASPSGGTATAASPNQIDLGWIDNSDNEDGFKVYRGLSVGIVNTLIATLGPNTTGHSDLGLDPATTYFYRIYAFNAVGDSPGYASASATTDPVVSDETMGMYFDPSGTGDPLTSCEVVNFLDHITVKIVWMNPSLAAVGGFSCGWDLAGSHPYATLWTNTFPTQTIDVGQNNPSEGIYNIISGFGSPLATSAQTTLVDIDVFLLDGIAPGTPGDAIDVFMRNSIPEDIPGDGRPTVLSGDYLTVYPIDMPYVPGSPALQFNPTICTVQFVTKDSWGGVRRLFR